MSRLVPKDLAEAIIERVSGEADLADWDHLSQRDKTIQLARWVGSPQIGGVLQPLVGGDAETRLWLKEVALKRRARLRQPAAEDVVAQLLEVPYELVADSVGTKPHHATVRAQSDCYYVCWGPKENAKHLFWAAMNALEADRRLDDAWVVIVDTVPSPTPSEHRLRLCALAERCGVKIDWMGA